MKTLAGTYNTPLYFYQAREGSFVMVWESVLTKEVNSMNIFNLLGTLWREHERAHLNKSAIVLYFWLVYEANNRFWQGPIVVSWEFLGRVLGLSPNTLGRAISDLKSRGLITYERRGKHSAFWFPENLVKDDHYSNYSGNDSRNDSENDSELIHHYKNYSRNDSENDSKPDHYKNYSGNDSENYSEKYSENYSGNDSDPHINNKYTITTQTRNKKHTTKENTNKKPENRKTGKQETEKQENNIKSPKGDLTTFVVLPSHPDKRVREIIEVWETLIGALDPADVPLIEKALQVCYPAQIKNAIMLLAKSKLELLKEQGFLYVYEPLVKGAFGKRGKRKNQKGEWAEAKLAGLKEFLKEGGDGAS